MSQQRAHPLPLAADTDFHAFRISPGETIVQPLERVLY